MSLIATLLATLSVGLANGCFCPQPISSCGCAGGSYYNPYAGGGYGGGGYAQNGYATFYRDLTPFRQPYYQTSYYPQQYYPQGPSQVLPPMYALPNPRYIQPQFPSRPLPVPTVPRPQYVSLLRPAPAPYIPNIVQQKQIYTQPAAPYIPNPVPEKQIYSQPVAPYGPDPAPEKQIYSQPVAPYIPNPVPEKQIYSQPVAPYRPDPAPEKQIYTQPVAPYRPNPVPEKQVYIQPAAPVAPLPENNRVRIHDNGYGGDIVITTLAPAAPVAVTQAPGTVVETSASDDEVPDFDENTLKKGDKEEFYYVYYDEKGAKVGDSRSGTTYAPPGTVFLDENSTVAPVSPSVDFTTEKIRGNENYDEIVEETTATPVSAQMEVTTERIRDNENYDEIVEEKTATPVSAQMEVTTERIRDNENYDEIVEEAHVPTRTSIAPSYTPETVTSTTVVFMEPKDETSTVVSGKKGNTEIIYEDETVEYDDKPHNETITASPVTKNPQPFEFKRTAGENQVLVDPAENTGEGYRNAVNGVRIVKQLRHNKRKIHSN